MAGLKASVSVISTIEFGSLFQLLIVRGMKENLYMSLVVIGIATAWLCALRPHDVGVVQQVSSELLSPQLASA